MARVPQRGVFQPSREGQDLQREGDDLRLVIEKLDRRVKSLESLVWVGMAALWSEVGAPSGGWLLAHGGTVSRRKYADLFSVLGTSYGPGDGVTTFHIPNLTAAEPVSWDYWIYTGVYE